MGSTSEFVEVQGRGIEKFWKKLSKEKKCKYEDISLMYEQEDSRKDEGD